MTCPAAEVPVLPFSRINRADDTFSARRNRVSRRRTVGNTLNSTGRPIYMATIITTTDIMRSSTIKKSNINLGSGVMRAITISSTTMGTPSSLTLDKRRAASGFALTIAVSVLISAFNALSLSPALSAILLRPKMQTRGPLGRFFNGFDRVFEWTRGRYLEGVGALIRKSALAMLGLFCFWFAAGSLYRRLPTSFLPDEDQGTIYVTVRLPDAASAERTGAAT